MKITESQLRSTIRKIIKEQSFNTSAPGDPCERCGEVLTPEDVAAGQCPHCGYWEDDNDGPPDFDDHSCPVASKFISDLENDPMTHGMGAPVGEIVDGWMRKHRQTCPQCQEEWMEAQMP